MAQNTKIEWADSTFNPWIGCTKVSPACDFCYAATMSAFRGWTKWGTGEPRKRTQTWGNPLRWQREMLDSASSAPGHFSYAADGRRRRVFCASLADIFDNEVDPAWRADLFRLIEETHDLEYMLLTKRVGNVVKMVADARGAKGLPANAAIGATIENQTVWDRDSEKLFRAKEATGALYSFTSFEPMLGPIDMRGRQPDWVIVGGESMSKGSRRMEADWARSVRDQCAQAGTPFIFKQWGDWNEAGERVGKKKAGRVLDGRTHDDIIETRGPGYAAAMGMVTTPVPPQPQPAPIVVQGPPAPQPVAVEDRDAQTHRVLTEIAGLIAQLAERFSPQSVLEGERPEDDDPTPTPPQPPKGKGDADRASKRSDAARKAHATRKANGWVHPSKRQGEAAPAASPSTPAASPVTPAASKTIADVMRGRRFSRPKIHGRSSVKTAWGNIEGIDLSDCVIDAYKKDWHGGCFYDSFGGIYLFKGEAARVFRGDVPLNKKRISRCNLSRSYIRAGVEFEGCDMRQALISSDAFERGYFEGCDMRQAFVYFTKWNRGYFGASHASDPWNFSRFKGSRLDGLTVILAKVPSEEERIFLQALVGRGAVVDGDWCVLLPAEDGSARAMFDQIASSFGAAPAYHAFWLDKLDGSPSVLVKPTPEGRAMINLSGEYFKSGGDVQIWEATNV